jgi:hypothetical protein
VSLGFEADECVTATIEILYHAVAILSCHNKVGEPPKHSSPSYVRQSRSASQVTVIVSQDGWGQLVLLPWVPYAVSLSLSVAYREMRRTKIPLYRARARGHLQENCSILERLGETFSFASTMAEMGKSTLHEMDRVYSVVKESRQRKTHRDRRSGVVEIRSTRDITPLDAANEHGMPTPSVYYTRIADDAIGENQPSLPPSPPTDWDLSEESFARFDQMNPGEFYDIPDFDVFANFDHSFDLEGVDNYLGGNLDLSFPFAINR